MLLSASNLIVSTGCNIVVKSPDFLWRSHELKEHAINRSVSMTFRREHRNSERQSTRHQPGITIMRCRDFSYSRVLRTEEAIWEGAIEE